MSAQRWVQRKARRLHSIALFSHATGHTRYTGQGTCPRAPLPSSVDPCFPTACIMVKQALFILNYNAGPLPENMPFETGRICSSSHREEAYVCNMAGEAFLWPSWHKAIENPQEFCSHSAKSRTPLCLGFEIFSQLRHHYFHSKTKKRKNCIRPHKAHRRAHAIHRSEKRLALPQWVLRLYSVAF